MGDILAPSEIGQFDDRARAGLASIYDRLYRPAHFDRLDQPRLRRAYEDSVVFCWLFQNMTEALAEEVHIGLQHRAGYLGSMSVSFGNALQLLFFRRLLSERFRFRGAYMSIFYSGNLSDSQDRAVDEILEAAGFRTLYEDIGGRNTIFDSYNSLDHFKRIEKFEEAFNTFNGMSEDLLAEAVLVLEEIHP